MMFLLTGRVPEPQSERIASHLLSRQSPDGSWPSYFGGPGDLSVSVQAYFALKLAGLKPGQPGMRTAREFIRRAGGIEGVNTITRIWLALFGQVSWEEVPTIPPELILLPSWAPLNIYEFASWSRATIVALMAIIALRPVSPVPASASLQDISIGGNGKSPGESRPSPSRRGWEAVFLRLDRLLKAWEASPLKPLRRSALRKIEEWILAHQEEDGSWGGILLPWVYSLIALKSLGRPAQDPVIRKSLLGLESFFIEEKGGLWLQPATSPVWDTAWSVIALRESGLPADHPALRRAAGWLMKQEIRRQGDWSVKNPRTPPGCWAFEFVNRFYPDLDDTAIVPRALLRVRLDGPEEERKQEAIRRAAAWVRAMQCKDGGWAAFDRDNNRRILSHVPYGDFMTPLDPASPDVTAHVLELLCELGNGSPAVSAGIRYLRRRQEPDGAWYGRWGVNYLYGTGLSLAALAAAGEQPEEVWIQKALAWLEACQNPDGGWGESCHSYDEPSLRGQGPSTASQSAWALLGLRVSTSNRKSASLRLQRGIDYLVASQRSDGQWLEQEYTGTGFPRAFYLRYDLYRLYFPLLALARCGNAPSDLSEPERLMSRIPPGQRVLLVSHCLRKSSGCQAVQGKWGLECRHCTQTCAVHRLSEAARRRGYKGVCIAPGGSMALSYVRRTQPRGIVAVACRKELEQGMQAVSAAAASSAVRPAVLAIPLTKDGCVDTEVDVPRALQTIELGGTPNV
ncbi:MAG: squalene--hopene cyclase [Spirochaetes bacterium RBG_16_67_19]|nr:MAG: squalene--hopene cyclase [Spirochaetes bacterium RBG_16_67_19]